MFYSHQLLARKAPLGQIWMAATMHAKINRKNLSKLNIVRVCEEILNPSVPMALRLSGILMGGVVIVYKRKVKLLYGKVEINQAWKVEAVPEKSHASKSKSRPKSGAKTVSKNQEEDVGEIEQPLHHSDPTTVMDFNQTSYFDMRLDKLDEQYINHNPQDDLPQDYHQADAENITLFERFDSCQANTTTYNRFERFDIEGEDDTQLNFTAEENTTIPSTLIPSPPPPQEKSSEPGEILEHLKEQVNQQSDEGKKVFQDPVVRPNRRRAKRPAPSGLDYEQTIIPGHIYQSWLQNSSEHLDFMSRMKTSTLMELPPLVLIEKLFSNGTGEVHFPAPLMQLWMRSTQPPHDSPSVRTSTPQPPEVSSSSPVGKLHDQDPLGYVCSFFHTLKFHKQNHVLHLMTLLNMKPFEDWHGGIGSQPLEGSIEKLRANRNNNSVPPEILMQGLTKKANGDVSLPEANGFNFNKNNLMSTPADSDAGDEIRSIPSSGSGHAFSSHNSDVKSGRSSRKRPCPSSIHIGNGLEPVAEENPWQYPSFKLARLSGNALAPETEPLMETGPTQSQKHPIISEPNDQITQSIRTSCYEGLH
ncbi:hypothetical protein M9H77_34611 [Catharanthus roseus]|uniref:Uncharacterized protein n=1 Tax=Catharanthus roseus TaxID=4058 RepID=A0ACB9ZLN9_CATRO|nr:hypothetical protein M9H77_34611 [Catharanthus roseus]